MDDRPPTIELLEERHEFPGPYTFKVIGAASDGFRESVAECVRAELGMDAPPETSVKTAAGGRHESVTVEPVCPDAQSVLRVYGALKALPNVVFLF